MRSRWAKYWYLGPAIVVVLATITYPLLSALITSFREWQLNESAEPGRFVGLENYQRVLQDAGFWNSAWVTVLYSIISVSITMLLALAIALVLQGPGRFKAFAKTMLILPYAVAPALKGFSWRFMLNENYGVYDTILDKIPFTQGIVWLGDPFWALVSIAMSEVWGWAPLIALMFIGALGSIDPEVQEAARVDGANGMQLFFRITLPLLAPVILVAMLLKTIFSLKLIDQVVTMTGGGPGNSTETLNYFIYRQGFSFLDMGYASALAWISVLGIAVFTVFYVRMMVRQGSI
jgi:multiple sugar transport system permease protein